MGSIPIASVVFLSREQEQILNGSQGRWKGRLLEILLRIGERNDAKRFIPVSSAHLSGISYLTAGEGAIWIYKELSQEKAHSVVPTTINPCGYDIERAEELNLDKDFVSKQNEILKSLQNLGISTSCTCVPHFSVSVPNPGDHVAWAESSALSYVNSVLGAYTNRESGISALASSITGLTPEYGLHLNENRQATHEIILDPKISLRNGLDYSILGAYLGSILGDKIPFFRNIYPTHVQIKPLLAAMATSGQVSMAHFECFQTNIVEDEGPSSKLEKIYCEKKDLDEFSAAKFHSEKDPDLAVFGCPHLTLSEIDMILEFLSDKHRLSSDLTLWFFCPRQYLKEYPDRIKRLQKYGEVWFDTCMVVSPMVDRFSSIIVDSYKSYRYLEPRFKGRIRFLDRMVLMEKIFK